MAVLPMNLLTVVVPFISVTPQMRIWVPEALKSGITVMLVHDQAKSNASTNIGWESKQILQDFVSQGASLIEGHFGNPGAARNIGLEAVTSAWVAFWDSDDIPIVKNAVKALSDSSSSHFDYLVGDFIKKRAAQDSRTNEIVRDRCVPDTAIHPGIWRFFIQKSTIGELRFPDLIMGEDQVFLANYGLLSHKGKFLQYETYEYFIGNTGSLTNSRENQKKTVQALTRLIDDLESIEVEDKEFAQILILKLVYSSLKYGDWCGRKLVISRIRLIVRQQSVGPLAKAITKIVLNAYTQRQYAKH
jgi:glycosyltransferase involved in cell wall biosynthesis